MQSPFQQGAKVTCKTHLGPIPKNFVATVTGKDIKVIQNDDGEDFAIEFPRLRCYHSSRNYYISVQTKDELKRIVSAPSHASTYNAGWPVGLGQFKNSTKIQLKIQKDLVFSGNSTFKKDWVAQFGGNLHQLDWRRRVVDTNGDRINSDKGSYVWHLTTQMHVPYGVRLVNSGYGGYSSNNRVEFRIPLDLVKKTNAPLKGLTVPSGIKSDENVMRSRDPKHDHLKTPNKDNRNWFPDDAVGYVHEIVFDVRSVRAWSSRMSLFHVSIVSLKSLISLTHTARKSLETNARIRTLL